MGQSADATRIILANRTLPQPLRELPRVQCALCSAIRALIQINTKGHAPLDGWSAKYSRLSFAGEFYEASKMYQRILVAIDGSDTSNLALQEAIRLAKDQHAMLRLFHVVDLTMAYSSVEAPHVFEYQKAMEEAGKRVITDCSATAHAAGIEFDSKCVSTFGRHIYDVIEEAAKEWNADLIVIGTHGRRGVRRLLLGSVAEGFMRVSSKPVLLIRGG